MERAAGEHHQIRQQHHVPPPHCQVGSYAPSPLSNIGYMSGREKLSGLISEEETLTNNSAASRKGGRLEV